MADDIAITNLMKYLMEKYKITSGAAANMEVEINSYLAQCVDKESMVKLLKDDYDIDFDQFYTFEGEGDEEESEFQRG